MPVLILLTCEVQVFQVFPDIWTIHKLMIMVISLHASWLMLNFWKWLMFVLRSRSMEIRHGHNWVQGYSFNCVLKHLTKTDSIRKLKLDPEFGKTWFDSFWNKILKISLWKFSSLLHNKKHGLKLGDPKTKFLLLFFSAVRPFVRPKKLPRTLPLSDRPRSDLQPPKISITYYTLKHSSIAFSFFKLVFSLTKSNFLGT